MTFTDQELRWLLKEKYSLHDSEVATLISDLKRLKGGEPLDYIIGTTKFLGCHIDLSEKPLIPRPETEFWVGEVIKKLDRSKQYKILDLCCGSGCIGLSLLKHLPKSHVTFADLSPLAISQTKTNLKLNNFTSTRYRIVRSDLFNKLAAHYDLIFCNPPYVNPQKPHADSLKFEPAMALYAKEDGLQIIKRVLGNYSDHLKSQGHLFLEFGFGQKSAISSFCKAKKISKPIFFRDQYNRFRYLSLTE